MEIFNSAILKLTGYYLATIMALSVSFSVILYQVSSKELEWDLRPTEAQRFFTNFDGFEQLRQQRIADAREHLANNLVVINLAALAIGGGGSYFLARRTLKPIQEAMDAQNRFTSDASHELRTPLAVMQTEVEVALRDRSLDKKQMHSLLQSVLEEVNRLRTLSDRLLQLANDKNLSMTTVALDDVATEAVNHLVVAAQAKDITIENTVSPLKVRGNKDSLADMLGVIIDNAIKYSSAKTAIVVSSKQTDARAILKVTDKGMGIKASELPHIFDRFYRADSSRARQNIPGYGLGLSIAKRIVDMHKGTITVTSTPHKGSTFTINLPIVSDTSQKS
jgi:two-component system sensor histidine kinase CiaH